MRFFLPLLSGLCLLTAAQAEPQKTAPKTNPSAPQATASSKKADLHKLLTLLGAGKSNSDAARQRIQAAKKDPKLASLPEAYWGDLDKAASPDAFENILYPVFDKAYSHDEIKQFLKLMENPEFKLWIEKNPMEKVAKEGFPLFSKYMDDQAKKLREKHQPAPKK